MENKNVKCVMVIDENLPMGIISNTAAVMGVTLGKYTPEIVGPDVVDKTGNNHLGIVAIPVPILKGNKEIIKNLRKKLYTPEFEGLTVVDFSDVAQGCNIYEEFTQKIATVQEDELQYFGIGIYGNKKQVNKLTGSMPLLK
ncbi:DUF2000 domain-containing protein [Clostridioides sp. ES-S-0005-03]|uniref:DUF2000 domain-containing protein n=1 Tax=Clostridioides sp. ES-S-0005-03 TaxID=2770774 RepID=UPI001D101ACD|nr:DUF2000 domain-containing protein [Clostridioides sp. ES-S-0005-03]UDN48674.1 DUF2000 domain-containing protein [Clostridioides sp. ES-S-0173-01]